MLRFRPGATPVLVTRLPVGLRYAGVAAHGTKIYVAGGLSPAGDLVYVAETYTGRLLAWDVASPGKVESGSTVVEATKGHFDSLAVEAGGNVVVAAIRQGLCVVAPDGSGHEYVPLPDTMTTNVCFTGPDVTTAYATLSRSGRLVSFDWPRPGLRLAF